MEIDLNDIPLGVAVNQKEIDILKSAKIYKELLKIDTRHNYLILPMSVFNIIENHQYFEPVNVVWDNSKPSLYKVGNFCGYECYVDLYLQDTILLSHDKQKMRDNKLNSILESEEVIKDVEISITF